MVFQQWMPQPSPNRYEVRGLLMFSDAIRPSTVSGVVAILMQASADALPGPNPSGSYYSVEVQNIAISASGSCSATLKVYRRSSGILTELTSVPNVRCRSGMELRVVMSGGSGLGNGLAVYIDGVLWSFVADVQLYGRPGIGAYGGQLGGFGPKLRSVRFGPVETTAPQAVSSTSLAASYFNSCVNLHWAGAQDDANGAGVYGYRIYRGGSFLGLIAEGEFQDCATSPNTTYTYEIRSQDYHQNVSTGTSVTVRVPAAGDVDPRRVGAAPTGTYWGGAGEQIDTRSGNLNFSIPLLSAQGRKGKSVGFFLNYNSQAWRKDSAGTWKVGQDVGYGFGWTLMAGSITPVWDSSNTLVRFIFRDATGAEHSLTQSADGFWRSHDGSFLTYDASTYRVRFNDGSFWIMGAVSGGGEDDAGTRYPTEFRDSDNNHIRVRYAAGVGMAWTNSSARISEIEDVRAVSDDTTGRSWTYAFSYNQDSIPHLTAGSTPAIRNSIETQEDYRLAFSAPQTLQSPFPGGGTFGSTVYLTSITNSLDQMQSFEYDSSGELTKAITPAGGYLRWSYATTDLASAVSVRAVDGRYLSMSGGAETSHHLVLDSSHSYPIPAWGKIHDDSTPSEKIWNFETNAASSYYGFLTRYDEKNATTNSILVSKLLTWASTSTYQHPYTQKATTQLDPGTAAAVETRTENTVDDWGNVTQTAVYGYGHTAPGVAADRTYNTTFLTGSIYTSQFMFNRPTLQTMSGTVLGTNQNLTLASYSYDQGGPWYYWYGSSPYSYHVIEFSGPHYSGWPTVVTAGGVTQTNTFDVMGNMVSTAGPQGQRVTLSYDSSNDYAVPTAVTPYQGGSAQTNLQTSYQWNSFLGITQETRPNSLVSSVVYSQARPTSTTSAAGVVTTYAYTNSPATVKTTVSGRWAKTTYDGFGRVVKVERGTGTGAALSVVETQYAPCACSPLGKVWRVSQPYAPGGTVYWTTYVYDVLGRTTSATLPDGSMTTYEYAGNAVKVTDPAGKWKRYTRDAFGNLTQVEEPHPTQANTSYFTTYDYDLQNHLLRVKMTRDGVTQTRRFTYNTVGQLTSVENPEYSGTTPKIQYEYDASARVSKKTDPDGKYATYTYDDMNRLTEVNHSVNAVCAKTVISYDTNPYDQNGSANAWGRVTAIRNGAENAACPAGQFTEMYRYPAGGYGTHYHSTTVRMPVDQNGTYAGATISAIYATDAEGRRYYDAIMAATGFWYWNTQFDAMGRPNRVFSPNDPYFNNAYYLVNGITYNVADQPTNLTVRNHAEAKDYTETRTYNTMNQLTAQGFYRDGTLYANPQYVFTSGFNNGQISRRTDSVSGEDIVYSYDSLKRLSTAVAQATGPQYGEAYTYDGFGNLAQVAGAGGKQPGNSWSQQIDAATNRIVGGGTAYDANGNMTSIPGMTGLQYDWENRLTATPDANFFYDQNNKRIWKKDVATGAEQVMFYGMDGALQGIYSVTKTANPPTLTLALTKRYYSVAGLRFEDDKLLASDRLGSVVANGTTPVSYYPYGKQIGTFESGKPRFGTYFRDTSGLDYAMNRYYSSGMMGRFLTVDRYSQSGLDSGSWNRYVYTRGDPVNRTDASTTALKRNILI